MTRSSKKAAASAAAANSEAPRLAAAELDATQSQGGVSDAGGAGSADGAGAAVPPASNDTASVKAEDDLVVPPAVASAAAGVAEAPSGDDQVMAVVTARSRSRKPFRRGGVAWGAEFETVRVTPEQALAIALEPALEVRPIDEAGG